MIRQQPETDRRIKQDTHSQDRKTHNRIFKETEGHIDLLQGALCDHISRRSDQGKVTAHSCRKYQGHQQAGAFKPGFRCNSDHNRNKNSRCAGVGEDSAHQSDDHHDGNNQTAFRFRKLRDNSAHLIGHSCLKERTAHDKHRNKQYYVVVDKTGKGGFYIQNSGET